MRGDALEANWSKRIHSDGLPLLVSSLVLRDYECGQIDVACIKNNNIYCYEVKSSGHVSRQQMFRLRNSCELLGILFNKVSFFKILE